MYNLTTKCKLFVLLSSKYKIIRQIKVLGDTVGTIDGIVVGRRVGVVDGDTVG